MVRSLPLLASLTFAVLTGCGSAPIPPAQSTLSASAVTFGPTRTGTAAPPQTLTLTNSGGQSLTGIHAVFSGNDAFAENGSCGDTLSGGQSCAMIVNFLPAIPGNLSASLTVSNRALAQPQTVAISGVSAVPSAALSGTSISFPHTDVGATSTYRIAYANSGIVPLTIAKIAVTSGSAISFQEQDTCGTQLAAGATCWITASFSPTAPSNSTGAITIVDDAPGSPRTIALTGATGASGLSLDYQMVYLPSYGQSLAIGTWSVPALELTQPYDSLSFQGGVIAQAGSSSASVYSSLVPLVAQNWETLDASGNIVAGAPNGAALGNSYNPMGETPVNGALDTVKAMLIRENGLAPSDRPYIFIGSAPGQGGIPAIGLIRGTTSYNRLLQEVRAAASLAAAQNKTFGVPAVCWTQGESDSGGYPTSPPTAGYEDIVQQIFTNLNADIKAITHQTKDVQFLTYQTFAYAYGPGGFTIATEQLDLASRMPNVHIATPAYFLQTFGDNTHLVNTASRQIGAYYGKAFKRIVVDGNTSYAPLTPLSIRATGAAIQVTVSLDQTPLVVDTSSYTNLTGALPNYGFQLKDSANTAIPIQVAITARDTITITADRSVAAGSTLTYGASVDGVHAGWGNIRDSQGTIDTIAIPGGTPLPLHNWLRQFAHTF